jgi:Methyltransferase domain
MSRRYAVFFSVLALICCSLKLSAQLETIPNDVMQGIQRHVYSNGWNGENGWGKDYYDVLSKVIRENRYKTVAEVGVALGGHAEFILKQTDVEQYYGVDPYQCYDSNDGFQQDVGRYSSLSTQQNFDYLYQWVKNVRLSPFKTRCRLIREPSVKASSQFVDESLDCIFIDGDHRYEGVIQDLQSWFPKLKKGQLMLGDDYWMPPVAAAVNDFFAAQGKEVFFFTSNTGYKIWAVYK